MLQRAAPLSTGQPSVGPIRAGCTPRAPPSSTRCTWLRRQLRHSDRWLVADRQRLSPAPRYRSLGGLACSAPSRALTPPVRTGGHPLGYDHRGGSEVSHCAPSAAHRRSRIGWSRADLLNLPHDLPRSAAIAPSGSEVSHLAPSAVNRRSRIASGPPTCSICLHDPQKSVAIAPAGFLPQARWISGGGGDFSTTASGVS